MDQDFTARMLKPDGRGNVRRLVRRLRNPLRSVRSLTWVGKNSLLATARPLCNGDWLPLPPPDLISFANTASLRTVVRILRCDVGAWCLGPSNRLHGLQKI